MKKVTRGDLLDLGAYEEIRERFRSRIIAEKKRRRFSPSPELSVVFENTDTALFQIQEMLRTERITSETAIAHEIETYNDLIPDDDELSATMFVEISDRETRERRLVELAGLEAAVAVECDGVVFPARSETRGILADRTTAVHYLKFPLGDGGAARLRRAAAAGTGAATAVLFLVRHPALEVRIPLPRSVLDALTDDLTLVPQREK
jgi:hypothetical protein